MLTTFLLAIIRLIVPVPWHFLMSFLFYLVARKNFVVLIPYNPFCKVGYILWNKSKSYLTIVIFKFRSLKTFRRDYISCFWQNIYPYVNIAMFTWITNVLYINNFGPSVCITQFISFYELVTDRVPEIGFSGTWNWPKNGFKASWIRFFFIFTNFLPYIFN